MTAPYAVCDEFLAPAELDAVLHAATANRSIYRPSSIIRDGGAETSDAHERRSVVGYDQPFIEALFVERLSAYAPTIFERLRLRRFPLRDMEVQLTHTGDGEFFRAHRDNSHAQVSRRRVTFVYYFHREPRGFRGGFLRLFSPERGETPEERTSAEIEPRQNRLVAFDSSLLHELRPVSVPSGRFEDGRFTVNGWIHD